MHIINKFNNMPILQFLGALAKLWKATVSFVTSVCKSVWPHWMARFPLDRCSWNIFEYPSKKSVDRIQVSLTSVKNIGYFTWRPMYIYGSILL